MWQPSWRRSTSLGSLTTGDILAQKVGAQMGSNPGGVYVGSDGIQRYVKFYRNGPQAVGEVLANRIYNDLGFAAPDAVLLPYTGGKFLYASTMIPNLRPYGNTPADAREFIKGFPIDVLTMNWDVTGLDNDNIAYRPDGTAVRLDNGAAFLSRAQGEPKPRSLLLKVTEFDNFISRPPGMYGAIERYNEIAELAGITNGAAVPGFSSTVARAAALRDRHGGWSSYVAKNAPLFELPDARTVVEMLDARLAFLQAKAR